MTCDIPIGLTYSKLLKAPRLGIVANRGQEPDLIIVERDSKRHGLGEDDTVHRAPYSAISESGQVIGQRTCRYPARRG